jgi:hypothetical protein
MIDLTYRYNFAGETNSKTTIFEGSHHGSQDRRRRVKIFIQVNDGVAESGRDRKTGKAEEGITPPPHGQPRLIRNA